MPYRVGAKGSFGCSGYPALKEGTNEVMGCHNTQAEAAAQIYAINRSEGNIGKAMPNLKEGDFAMTAHGGDEEFHIGQVVHVMREGMLGVPGGEYTLEATPENPAVLIQLFEQEDSGLWEATRLYSACTMSLFIAIDPLPVEPELTIEDMPNMNAQPDLMDAYDASIGKVSKSMYRVDTNNAGCSGNFAVVDEEGDIEGCFETREQANAFVETKNKEEQMDDAEDMLEMDKAKKPNYGEMIQPRRGGSTPSNPRLYARVVQAAKDKFDVYPSAVANAWVVQEYKRRGGTYKSDSQPTSKSIWDGSFDPNGLIK
jgi:hypothetical protein